MAVQTTFSVAQSGAFAGMLGDIGDHYIRSCLNEEAVAIPFGVLLKQGTADNQGLLYDTVGGLTLLGIVAHTHALSNRDLSNADGVAVDGTANVVRRGAVYVLVEDAVAAGDTVFARHTAGTGTQLGAFRSDADTATADAIPGLQFLTSTTGAGVALVDVNLPQ